MALPSMPQQEDSDRNARDSLAELIDKVSDEELSRRLEWLTLQVTIIKSIKKLRKRTPAAADAGEGGS